MHSSTCKSSTAGLVVLQAAAILASGFLVALGVNALRPDGIPVIATVPYDIFAPCRDSEETADAVNASALESLAGSPTVIVVDARPVELFNQAGVENAVNVPFSVLFGAAEADLAELRAKVQAKPGATVLVYGIAAGVDLAAPLAAQLKEIGISSVKQIEGGLTAMQQGGFQIAGEAR